MEWLKEIINYLSAPQYYFTGFCLLFIVMMKAYPVWTRPKFFIGALIGFIAFLAFAFTDAHFYAEATKPDNIPIWIMTFSMIFFFWLCMRRGYLNDQLMAEGKDNLEKQESQKRVYTWPDLVYSELICMVAFFAFLLVWAILFDAPLEDPANSGITPPIAKAPWYFLGLQEMLVYYDPWIAGVVLPGLIVGGLIGIPYFDPNPKGNGYYTVKERFWAIWLFGFGYIVLWISLIFLGTFMRGPAWNFFGPFEVWDAHKVVAMSNINISEIFWVKLLNMGLPTNIFLRESVGLVLVGAYLVGLPIVFVRYSDQLQKLWEKLLSFLPGNLGDMLSSKLKLNAFKSLFEKVGIVRYIIIIELILIMFSLPIKMYLRWGFNLKYIISIPEFMFNI